MIPATWLHHVVIAMSRVFVSVIMSCVMWLHSSQGIAAEEEVQKNRVYFNLYNEIASVLSRPGIDTQAFVSLAEKVLRAQERGLITPIESSVLVDHLAETLGKTNEAGLYTMYDDDVVVAIYRLYRKKIVGDISRIAFREINDAKYRELKNRLEDSLSVAEDSAAKQFDGLIQGFRQVEYENISEDGVDNLKKLMPVSISHACVEHGALELYDVSRLILVCLYNAAYGMQRDGGIGR